MQQPAPAMGKGAGQVPMNKMKAPRLFQHSKNVDKSKAKKKKKKKMLKSEMDGSNTVHKHRLAREHKVEATAFAGEHRPVTVEGPQPEGALCQGGPSAKRAKPDEEAAAAAAPPPRLSPAQVERELLQIFAQHNPVQVPKVLKLMEKYAGTEVAFLAAVRRKYGVVADADTGLNPLVYRRAAATPEAMAAAAAAAAAVKGKMTYKAFESSRLAELKSMKPGLKGSEYRDMVKKDWKISPLNPSN